MLKILPRIATITLVVMLAANTSGAQETDTTRPVSVDPELLALQNARIPKEYTIGTINVAGVNYLDTGIVVSISGLQSGDKLMIPGTDAFSKAISNLWRQRLFSNVQIYITALRQEVIDIEIAVTERPKLGSFKFQGVKKSEAEELEKKAALVRSTIITENTRRNTVEAIKKYYIEKGYQNIQVDIQEKPDPSIPNASNLTFVIDKGKKVRVNEVNFYGNTQVPDLKLKRQMKGTKERSHFTLYPTRVESPYGTNDPITFKEYINDLGFLSATKTRNFLDPYFRFKLFSSAKFDPKKYEEDKEKILSEYNSLGFRDAQILDDTMYYTPDGHLNIDLKMSEGNRYYFGNITWRGNTKYADSILNNILGIQKGDIYNLQTLNQRLGKQLTPEGGDISGLYMDDGYLFFQANPVETSVYNDTIDHEIRIVEGPQATIRNVAIFGNEKTKDHVIRRELRTIPGEKFSRSDLIRSQRELAALNYFNQETINPGVVPNQEDGTVDINWKLEEKSSDQLELSAGWGGGIGLTGTLGVTFNNFSVKNIFNKASWDPLPTGDGQKLSLRLQSNGRAYRSYNFSFTEPWLSGRKRNPFTISFYNTKYSNAYNFATGRLEKSRADSSYLRITGATVSLGKQLKWPDDYFSIMYSLSYTQYSLKNYSGIFRDDQGSYLNNITSNNVSFKIALQRSSVFDPTFPRSGSNFLASVQMTPPYSLLNENFAKNNGQYKTPEYHKWRFNAEWFVPIGKPMGAEKNRQFVLKLAAKYGFMGRYNKNVAYSPFERYQLGGDGLTNQFGFLGYDVIALRGYPVFENSDPSVNPDLSQSTRQFTIFNKYQMELRYPLVTQPSSTIYGLAFFDAANGWFNFKEYNPFRLRRSVGVGMRFFLPMFGLLGFDYGVGLDRFQPGQTGLKGTTKFTFMLGFEPE